MGCLTDNRGIIFPIPTKKLDARKGNFGFESSSGYEHFCHTGKGGRKARSCDFFGDFPHDRMTFTEPAQGVAIIPEF